MVEVNNIKFSTSIAVLFALREIGGHKTLQETYASLSKSDIDSVLELMRVCYEKGENKKVTPEEFLDLLGEKDIGFVRLSRLHAEVVEKLLCSGMPEEEIASLKKQAIEQVRKT